MKKITNLFFIMLITGLSFGQGNANAKYTRWNVDTPEGKANLVAMNTAFEKMRAMGCDNGLAWYYQGAIHNIPTVINGKNVLCPQYQTSKDKLWAWADCTHNGSDSASLNFLLWHRMYIWYLEKIVRELSGKEDFALPYWNYGSKVVAENIMPAQLTDKSGSLYTAARYSILNNGKPILKDQVDQIQASLGELQTNPSFSGKAGFSKSLEIAPHGYMHDLIGGEYANPSETYYNEIYQKEYSGLMANVPSAGFDPVFWLHHSMIDRIWESWDVSAYGQRPSLEDLKANPWPYEFITPDGKHITYTMEEVYKIVFNLDYKYDNLLYGSKTPVLASNESTAKKKIAFQDSKEQVVWEQKIGKVLGTSAFTHKVTSTFAKSTNKVFKSANSKLVLNLSVSVYKEPKDYYTVFLRYPGKADQYVGTMTFFGVAHDHGMEDDHPISEDGIKVNFSYYISDDLANTDKNFEIIIKKSGAGDAKVTLEKISVTKAN
ncbi:tyrosinase family protein [Flavobacterium circumlabens]|uniref:Common central domain of tyrosinase n=1 Tax=Flavobacterium circumlabens TaxID=2133765 RepID=A0A4Y7UCL1_9FLAO|nr:tyrosinase family protein [Flavobacterium circumlabens]TCN58750.1 common central domain of tyrosinase [Flavobacterium circumlabens]TEB44165.1 tyrosinase family protein [Flavobacterium circumlabens]